MEPWLPGDNVGYWQGKQERKNIDDGSISNEMVPHDVWAHILDTFCTPEEVSMFLSAFAFLAEPYAHRTMQYHVMGNAVRYVYPRHRTRPIHLVIELCSPKFITQTIKHIQEMRIEVQGLCVKDCVLGRQQLQHIRRLLEASPRIHTLSLSPVITDHHGTQEANEVRKILRAVAKCSLLKTVTLTSIASSPITQIFSCLPSESMVELCLDRIMPSSLSVADLISQLNQFVRMRVLTLRYCRLPRFTAVHPSLNLPKLEILRMTDIEAPSYSIKAFWYPYTLPRLVELEFRGHSMPEAGRPFRRCRLQKADVSVQELRLADIPHLTDMLDMCPLLHDFRLGGVTRSLVTAALYHRLGGDDFLPSLRHFRFEPPCRPDSFVVQTAILLRRRSPPATCTWTTR